MVPSNGEGLLLCRRLVGSQQGGPHDEAVRCAHLSDTCRGGVLANAWMAEDPGDGVRLRVESHRLRVKPNRFECAPHEGGVETSM